jgi:hypothetical protein
MSVEETWPSSSLCFGGSRPHKFVQKARGIFGNPETTHNRGSGKCVGLPHSLFRMSLGLQMAFV